MLAGIALILGLIATIVIHSLDIAVLPSADKSAEAPTCPPLPQCFNKSDLVGTWVGRYLGDSDKLIITEFGVTKVRMIKSRTDDSLNDETTNELWNEERQQ